MLRATHGHLASKNENKRQKIFGRWFKVITAGTTDKVAMYWYAEPSVLTHRSWCGDYTHTRMHTNSIHATLTQTHAPTHATLTPTHAATHARNTHTHTRTHACTHQYTTRPTHTLTLKCSTYTCMRTNQALTDTYTTR